MCDKCIPTKWDPVNKCNGVCPANCAVKPGECYDNGYCKIGPGDGAVVTCKNNMWGDKCDKKCKDDTKYYCAGPCTNIGTGDSNKM